MPLVKWVLLALSAQQAHKVTKDQLAHKVQRVQVALKVMQAQPEPPDLAVLSVQQVHLVP